LQGKQGWVLTGRCHLLDLTRLRLGEEMRMFTPPWPKVGGVDKETIGLNEMRQNKSKSHGLVGCHILIDGMR